MITDDCEQYITASDSLLEMPAKVYAERNGVHILEHLRLPKAFHQAIVNTSGDVGAILSTVGHEDSALLAW